MDPLNGSLVYSLVSGSILNTLIDKARQAVAPYQGSGSSPHPSFVFNLPNEVHAGSNLFAFQKHFDGAFQFDVLFDSASTKQKLTCACHFSSCLTNLFNLFQHPHWILVCLRWSKTTGNASTKSYHIQLTSRSKKKILYRNFPGQSHPT